MIGPSVPDSQNLFTDLKIQSGGVVGDKKVYNVQGEFNGRAVTVKISTKEDLNDDDIAKILSESFVSSVKTEDKTTKATLKNKSYVGTKITLERSGNQEPDKGVTEALIRAKNTKTSLNGALKTDTATREALTTLKESFSKISNEAASAATRLTEKAEKAFAEGKENIFLQADIATDRFNETVGRQIREVMYGRGQKVAPWRPTAGWNIPKENKPNVAQKLETWVTTQKGQISEQIRKSTEWIPVPRTNIFNEKAKTERSDSEAKPNWFSEQKAKAKEWVLQQKERLTPKQETSEKQTSRLSEQKTKGKERVAEQKERPSPKVSSEGKVEIKQQYGSYHNQQLNLILDYFNKRDDSRKTLSLTSEGLKVVPWGPSEAQDKAALNHVLFSIKMEVHNLINDLSDLPADSPDRKAIFDNLAHIKYMLMNMAMRNDTPFKQILENDSQLADEFTKIRRDIFGVNQQNEIL